VTADGFGYKTAWVAARSVSPDELASALALRDSQPTAWQAGVEASYGDGRLVFVTPRLGDWTLCTGVALLDATGGRPPEFPDLIQKIAARLHTVVQFFATHRVVELHAWGRATAQAVDRAYMYVGESGETMLDVGLQTPEEQSLGFAFFNSSSSEAQVEGYWEREDLTFPDEESVMRLAALWSLDPSALPGAVAPESGVLGKYGEPRSPQLVPPQPPAERRRWKFW
jgi:hypothetical protein